MGGRAQVGPYGLNDDAVDDQGNSYSFKNNKEALAWVSKYYDRKFSITVSLKDGFTFLRTACMSADLMPYDFYSHNCANVIADGLHGINLVQDYRPNIYVPNGFFEYLKCALKGVSCPPNFGITQNMKSRQTLKMSFNQSKMLAGKLLDT